MRGTGSGTLVIIGGTYGSHPSVDDAAGRLLAPPNVVMLGEKGPDRCRRISRRLTWASRPIVDDAFNRKSYPLKIPQYLAAGLAISVNR